MKELKELIEIIERLLAPNGCPWDREQTLHSMRHSLLEEACELIDAINVDEDQKIEEELGDLLFNALFMGYLAAKEGRFTLDDAVRHINAKLIRRHPHIFGTAKVENSEQVLKQWEEIKKAENPKRSLLDSIPRELPSLARALKMIKKMKKSQFSLPTASVDDAFQNEDNLGASLFDMVKRCDEANFDPEQALRSFLTKQEQAFHQWEELSH